ncbi:family 78 glycoside hydrolase catalytic domain [Sphingomonas sp.]|jgi:hypothetical protein|uniref:family 78 glycoside hydrolase catalytic domain n=1 Tax=Sphingomonas sp. TaxID=28214 RepID=UPI002EDB8580
MAEVTRRDALLGAAALGLHGTARAGSPDGGAGALGASELRIDHRDSADGLNAARPRFGWTLTARDPARRDLRQRRARLVLTAPGGAIVFDSGRVAGTAPWLVPARDVAMPPQTPLRWRVMIWDQDDRPSPWSAEARFVTGAAPDWRGQWIAAESDGVVTAPADEATRPATSRYVLPLLRRRFRIDRPVRHAVVCVSGLGAHVLSINGKEPSVAILNPGWTDYRRTILYETIDVSDHLRLGDNMLGIRLGGGIYDVAGAPGRYSKFIASFGAPKLILQLRIVHVDGTERWIVSDDAWQARPGPVQFSSIFGGEDHDARREPTGWNLAGAADGPGWEPVRLTRGPGGVLTPQGTPGLAVAERVVAIARTHVEPGVTVHDLGRNFAGRPIITVRGAPGSVVRITPGELLDERGRVTQKSMGASPDAAIRFTYILGQGDAAQTWAPRFSYTGFRYLEVEGGGVVDVAGEFVRAALPETGAFTCSAPAITAIHRLIRAAVLSNVATVLTDCPHREKLGWLEQTWLNARTILSTVDALPLYAKMTGDMIDAQRSDGMVPSIAPEYIRFVDGAGRDTPFRHSPEWGSAIVQAPWAAYRFSGDPAILLRAYPAMLRYMAFLEKEARGSILDVGLGDWYDLGPKPPGEAQLTSRAFTGTAVWYDDLIALVRIATLLGHAGDAAAFAARAERVKAAIDRRFFDPATGIYDRDSQTANAMVLALDLAPPARRTAVHARLIAAIDAREDHVSAGDIGFHYLVRALAAQAPDRLARMLFKRDGASYGAQIARGATALTEAWDANPASSQNHFMLGHVMGWLIGGLGGIDLDFARGEQAALRIAPVPVAGITAASATLRTAVGTVRTRWSHDARGVFHLHAIIPPGVSAAIHMPGAGDQPRLVGSGAYDLIGQVAMPAAL